MDTSTNRPDYAWLTDDRRDFLSKDYLCEGDTPESRIRDIGETAERILGKSGLADRFETYMKRGYYSLASPIWSNFGNDRGLPISCFGSYIGDSMLEILDAHREVGMMSKYGGGTSGYLGDIRGRGTLIQGGRNGKADGPVHFSQMFETEIKVVSQGSTRRGQFAGYIPVTHPDIMEWLAMRTEGSPIQDMSFGVCIPRAWMQTVRESIASKVVTPELKVWARILKARAETGYPYLFFSDNANDGAADVYRDKGMTITHSNLCVTGDQLVVTDKGMKRASDLYDSGEALVLFDGEKPVHASPMRRVERDVEVFEIQTESGRTHRVTGYHKVKTSRGMVAASDLSKGDRLCIQREKGLFGRLNDPKQAFLLGMYQGDGTGTDDTVFIDVWENDFDLIDEIESSIGDVYKDQGWDSYSVPVPGRGDHQRTAVLPTFSNQKVRAGSHPKKRMQSAKLKQAGFKKGEVPQWMWDADEPTQGQYLRGLFFSDGTVRVGTTAGNPLQLSLASIDRPFLQQIQILLSNHGINSRIYLLREAGQTLLPDGRGGERLYDTKDCYRLCISHKRDALRFEALTGFLARKGVRIEDRVYRDNTKKFDDVVAVVPCGREDVYCTTVDSQEHVWVCNSFVTSNCTEIMEPDGVDESFVCCLSSLNILWYPEWIALGIMEEVVETIVEVLDAVMSEFIDKASHIPGFERAVNFARRHRALGLGWIGWHSYLQNLGIPFEGMEAQRHNVEIAKATKKHAYAASARLAEAYGEPEVLKGYGRRNTTLLAIAPTKSSAFIAGASAGIEPVRSNYYIEDLQKGKYTVRNPFLKRLLEEKDQDNEETWNAILQNEGSVQHLDFLSDREKGAFKTFREVSPKEIIVQAAARQRHIDQGQSVNVLVDPSIAARDVSKLFMEAEELGIKSLYYQINKNAAQEFARNFNRCVSCEG